MNPPRGGRDRNSHLAAHASCAKPGDGVRYPGQAAPSPPPERSQGAEEGLGPPNQQRALPTRIQGIEGDTPTRHQAPPSCSQGTDYGGEPPREQCSPSARPEGEGKVRNPRTGRGGEGTPQAATRAICARPAGDGGGGGGLTQRGRMEHPPIINERSSCKACRRGGKG